MFDVSLYIPAKLRDKELYQKVSSLLNAILQITYEPHVKALAGQYNPASPDYDAEAFMQMIKGKEYTAALEDVDLRKISKILPRIYYLKGTPDGIRFLLGVFGMDVEVFNWWEILRSYNNKDKRLYEEWQRVYPDLSISDVKNCHIYATVLVDVEVNPILQSSDDTLILQVQDLVTTFTWVCAVLDFINWVAKIPTTHVKVSDKISNFQEWVKLLQKPFVKEQLYDKEEVNLDGTGKLVFQHVEPSDYVYRYNHVINHSNPLHPVLNHLYGNPIYAKKGINVWTDILEATQEEIIKDKVHPTGYIHSFDDGVLIPTKVHTETSCQFSMSWRLATKVESRLRYTGYAKHDSAYNYDAAFLGFIVDELHASIEDLNSTYKITLQASQDTPEAEEQVQLFALFSDGIERPGTWSLSTSLGSIGESGILTCSTPGQVHVHFTDGKESADITLQVLPKTSEIFLFGKKVYPKSTVLDFCVGASVGIRTNNNKPTQGSITCDVPGIDMDFEDGAEPEWFFLKTKELPPTQGTLSLKAHKNNQMFLAEYPVCIWTPSTKPITLVEGTGLVSPVIEGCTSVPPCFKGCTSNAQLSGTEGTTLKLTGTPGTYWLKGQIVVGDYSADFEYTVHIVKSQGTIKIDIPDHLLVEGDTVQLTAAEATGTWAISNSAFASISQTGELKVLANVDADMFVTFTTPSGKVGLVSFQIVQNQRNLVAEPSSISAYYGDMPIPIEVFQLPKHLKVDAQVTCTNGVTYSNGCLNIPKAGNGGTFIANLAYEGMTKARAITGRLMQRITEINLYVDPILQVGVDYQIKVDTKPVSTEPYEVISSDPEIVSLNGMTAVAHSAGQCTISVVTAGGLTKAIQVTVQLMPTSIEGPTSLLAMPTDNSNRTYMTDTPFYVMPLGSSFPDITSDTQLKEVDFYKGSKKTKGFYPVFSFNKPTSEVLHVDLATSNGMIHKDLTVYAWTASLSMPTTCVIGQPVKAQVNLDIPANLSATLTWKTLKGTGPDQTFSLTSLGTHTIEVSVTVDNIHYLNLRQAIECTDSYNLTTDVPDKMVVGKAYELTYASDIKVTGNWDATAGLFKLEGSTVTPLSVGGGLITFTDQYGKSVTKEVTVIDYTATVSCKLEYIQSGVVEGSTPTPGQYKFTVQSSVILDGKDVPHAALYVDPFSKESFTTGSTSLSPSTFMETADIQLPITLKYDGFTNEQTLTVKVYPCVDTVNGVPIPEEIPHGTCTLYMNRKLYTGKAFVRPKGVQTNDPDDYFVDITDGIVEVYAVLDYTAMKRLPVGTYTMEYGVCEANIGSVGVIDIEVKDKPPEPPKPPVDPDKPVDPAPTDKEPVKPAPTEPTDKAPIEKPAEPPAQ